MNNKLSFLHEPKTHIGWVHGLIASIGGTLLAFLFTSIITQFLDGDFALRIVPSMLVTPIFISIFGIWILFSNTIFKALLKFVGALLLLGGIFFIKATL